MENPLKEYLKESLKNKNSFPLGISHKLQVHEIKLKSVMIMLSIIVPCFNEEESIDLFYGETIKYIDDFEIIFVDDGSKDNTLEKIKNLCN